MESYHRGFAGFQMLSAIDDAPFLSQPTMMHQRSGSFASDFGSESTHGRRGSMDSITSEATNFDQELLDGNSHVNMSNLHIGFDEDEEHLAGQELEANFDLETERPTATGSKRKQRKNNREKKRRSELNDKFEILTGILNMQGKTKVEKYTILNEAINLIQMLRNENTQIRHDKIHLRKELRSRTVTLQQTFPGAVTSQILEEFPEEEEEEIPFLMAPDSAQLIAQSEIFPITSSTIALGVSQSHYPEDLPLISMPMVEAAGMVPAHEMHYRGLNHHRMEASDLFQQIQSSTSASNNMNDSHFDIFV